MTDVLFLIRGVGNYHLVVYPHSIGVPGATDYSIHTYLLYTPFILIMAFLQGRS